MPKTEQYSPLPPWPRTDYCGAICATDVGHEVSLWGRFQNRRDYRGLIFIELRVAVKGKVARRAEGTVNADLPTGEIEMLVSTFECQSASAPPPFQIADA